MLWHDDDRIQRECRKVGYGFRVKCVVPRDLAPRDPMFEWTLEAGAGMYDDLFAGKPLPMLSKDRTCLFIFPERHLSVREQYAFLGTLNKHPDGKGLAEVRIITHAPCIISTCPKDSLVIINKGETDGLD